MQNRFDLVELLASLLMAVASVKLARELVFAIGRQSLGFLPMPSPRVLGKSTLSGVEVEGEKQQV